MHHRLYKKYNKPGPRYTSFPTVPFWDETQFSTQKYLETLVANFQQNQEISLYIHLPFCESLCTFCACHKHVTKRHDVENEYINSVIKEWQLYTSLLPSKPIIKEIHLGGGTPTFFAPEQLEKLITNIFDKSIIPSDIDFSFEGHPNNTTKKHLQTLYDLGCKRVSFGVQDYNPEIQKAINRIQPFENVQKVTEWARAIGYTSISHDLVFGLPFQTFKDVENTISLTNIIQPDRISFYSYAHVPWIKGVGQRGFKDEDVPKAHKKRRLYEVGKHLLETNNYFEVGFDHFAKPDDTLFKAMQNQTLHRNFMGYTTQKTNLMIGLGMSSISDTWYGFAQNVKTVNEYQQLVNQQEFPIFKGHILTDNDLKVRQLILDLMCNFATFLEDIITLPYVDDEAIHQFLEDELIEINQHTFAITPKGKPFVRNICMAFDFYLSNQIANNPKFSLTI